jgi:hypothetical protein
LGGERGRESKDHHGALGLKNDATDLIPFVSLLANFLAPAVISGTLRCGIEQEQEQQPQQQEKGQRTQHIHAHIELERKKN